LASRKKTVAWKLASKQRDALRMMSVAFSPDCKTLATVGYDHTIRLWDTATGKETATLRGHVGSVTAVVFSPDGRTLASAELGTNRTVKLWDLGRDK
jgi:WD40 repeat protein